MNPISHKNTNALLLIIILLWMLMILSLVMIWKFDTPFLLGISGLTLSTILYFINKKSSLYMLALILFLSIFNWIKFSYSIGLNFKSIFFIINLLNLVLFVLLLATHQNYFFAKREGGDSNEQLEKEQRKVDFFKRQFKDLNHQELVDRSNEPSLVKEAKTAIDELLAEYNQNIID